MWQPPLRLIQGPSRRLVRSCGSRGSQIPFAYIAIFVILPMIPKLSENLGLTPAYAGLVFSVWFWARSGRVCVVLALDGLALSSWLAVRAFCGVDCELRCHLPLQPRLAAHCRADSFWSRGRVDLLFLALLFNGCRRVSRAKAAAFTRLQSGLGTMMKAPRRGGGALLFPASPRRRRFGTSAAC